MEPEIPYVAAALPSDTTVIAFDKLATIFDGQRALMARYHDMEKKNGACVVSEADMGDIGSRYVQAREHELFGWMVRELGEAMQELPSKPWKHVFGEVDETKFREELADAFHFFVEMCITAGMTADDLFDSYFSAWQKNRKRQENGY